jgi:hypothetical protein
VIVTGVPDELSDRQAGELDLLAALHDLEWTVGLAWSAAAVLDGLAGPQHAVHLSARRRPFRASPTLSQDAALELAGPIVEQFGLRLRAP